MRSISLPAARRIALAAQGFADPRPAGRHDVRHLKRVIERTSVVQLDSVNVFARAHYMPFLSRVGGPTTDRIDRHLNDGAAHFEYWGHQASVMPVELHPLFRWKMKAVQDDPWPAIRQIDADRPGFVDRTCDAIADRGPLTISDLDDVGTRSGGWWRSEGRLVLEWLFATGRLTASRRSDFARVYDLPERRLPATVLTAPAVDEADARRDLVARAAKSLGVFTLADAADYWRFKQADTLTRLKDLEASGVVERVAVQCWREPAWLAVGSAEPRRVHARALLSPFDPLVWYRPRARRLFDFTYLIEIYVPEPKRVHGYYVLPFLLGDEIVARVDLKADRAGGRLLVRSAWLEPGGDAEHVAAELAATLHEAAAWAGVDEVAVEDRGDLVGALRVQCAKRGFEPMFAATGEARP